MNKQNTKTEATRSETLKKWTLETLCSIAVLISGHPEIEDDVLEQICDNVESVELLIHTYLKSLNDPEAPLYAVDIVKVDTKEVITTSFYKHKDSAYKYLKEMEDEIKKIGCVGIVRPIPQEEVDRLCRNSKTDPAGRG